MKVFGHEHITNDYELIPAAHPVQYFEEKVATGWRAQEWTMLVATAGDAVQMTRAVVAFEALGHGKILWGDAGCACDGQTLPTRRQSARRVGHPRFIRYIQPFMAGRPAGTTGKSGFLAPLGMTIGRELCPDWIRSSRDCSRA